MPWKALAGLIPPVPPRRREDLPSAPEGTQWEWDEEKKQWALKKVDSKVNETLEQSQSSTEAPELADEGADIVVDTLPSHPQPSSSDHSESEGWEFLSDRASTTGGSHQTPVLVARAGSVRSIGTADHLDGGSQHTLSTPFKIQRTTSSSTIDSSDNILGPSGKGVLGVDYVEHVILPTDTLQGICLAYKIHVTRLRQANGFSGNSLSLAPKKLVIPLSKQALRAGFIRVQDTDAKEYKLHAFLAEFPTLSMSEARGYLELADWILKDALRSAKQDGEWEDDVGAPNMLKSGEIRISKPGAYKFRGAGIGNTSLVPKKHEAIPAITSKSVKAQDVMNASPQHNNVGVELQCLGKKL